jgi:hypothetical protein
MVESIYFDLDETLIHATDSLPMWEDFRVDHVNLEISPDEVYFLYIRPVARPLIVWAQELVGVENVHILTTSTREYALKVIDIADFPIPESQVYSREFLSNPVLPHSTAHPNNVLVDNLRWRDLMPKLKFGGMTSDRLITVKSWFGEAFDEEDKEFVDKVKNTIIEL